LARLRWHRSFLNPLPLSTLKVVGYFKYRIGFDQDVPGRVDSGQDVPGQVALGQAALGRIDSCRDDPKSDHGAWQMDLRVGGTVPKSTSLRVLR